MTDRSRAGRIARRRGASAEREYVTWLRDIGYIAARVRDEPFDVIWFDEREFGLSQVKSYVLSETELDEAKKELAATIAPAGTIKEVVMKDRKRGGRAASSGWRIETVEGDA